MSYLSNLNKFSLNTTSSNISSTIINLTSKPFSINNVNKKASYHLNTSNLSIQNTLSNKKINFQNTSIRNYAVRQCCVNSQISDVKYHQLVLEFFDNLSEEIEIILEDSNLKNYDIELSDGVLTINLGSAGTYVINKQTANKQIWYSSPISGPRKYIYDPNVKRWVGLTECDSKEDNRFIEVRLSQELSQILKKEIVLRNMNEDGK